MEVPFQYRLIDDLNNPPHYADHVFEHFGIPENPITLFSSNPYTTDCFRGKDNCTIIPIEEHLELHATQLRALYARGIDISALVPPHIPSYLQHHERQRRIQKLTFDNPIPTVDIVIEYQDKLVIIKRKEKPLGYALVGGHIDPGESAEQAAVREAEEETGLQVQLTRLVGVYSKPGRDPRPGHRISIAYAGIGNGEIKPGSDAEKVILCDSNEVPALLFDHNQILNDYRTKKGQNL
ncbi:TPA: NUDIX hydrolase [Candidatus Woesearchaeota archaeon]|nr:NUDIX hydrolase [Candidatus Woesearchaeota archaeon]